MRVADLARTAALQGTRSKSTFTANVQVVLGDAVAGRGADVVRFQEANSLNLASFAVQVVDQTVTVNLRVGVLHDVDESTRRVVAHDVIEVIRMGDTQPIVPHFRHDILGFHQSTHSTLSLIHISEPTRLLSISYA